MTGRLAAARMWVNLASGVRIAAWDVDVRVLEQEARSDGRRLSFEELAVSRAKSGQEIGAGSWDRTEGILGITEHGSDVDAVRGKVHQVQHLCEVCVQLEKLGQLLGDVLSDEKLISGTKEGAQLKPHVFQTLAQTRR